MAISIIKCQVGDSGGSGGRPGCGFFGWILIVKQYEKLQIYNQGGLLWFRANTTDFNYHIMYALPDIEGHIRKK